MEPEVAAKTGEIEAGWNAMIGSPDGRSLTSWRVGFWVCEQDDTCLALFKQL